MIQLLPTELLWTVLNNLEYGDLDNLWKIKRLEPTILYYIQTHYKFHYQISSLLRIFEAITPTARQQGETKTKMAREMLEFIRSSVACLPKYEHRSKFTELLDIVQQLTLQRILASDFKANGLEHDYAGLCLQVRALYLHTPSIRVLHDPKYRRRSTKHPLAPFLPRDYTFVWRLHCSLGIEKERGVRTRFANFFGGLFEATSLYLESNLDGTFEECVREALVTGNAQDLLILCVAAARPVDVEGMCMMVTDAGEQLRHYLDTMDHWMTTDPTPQQTFRLHQEDDRTNSPPLPPPEWLIPDRYKVNKDAVLRLQVKEKFFWGMIKRTHVN
ncbi:hypothetical protein INT47_002892 [Mucor saturninus]|uniref:F-box domain-containing protein n=1 Tax=Mucor saturninus TaxID=64648 RepID=A0A8H7UXE8_9FUNG|nr:hypothetical protein INT47_002892 [Mucor saturninus]